MKFLFSPNKFILIFSLLLYSDHFLYTIPKEFLHLHLIHKSTLYVQSRDLGPVPDILARIFNLESINSQLSSLISYLLRLHTSWFTHIHALCFPRMLVASSYFLDRDYNSLCGLHWDLTLVTSLEAMRGGRWILRTIIILRGICLRWYLNLGSPRSRSGAKDFGASY